MLTYYDTIIIAFSIVIAAIVGLIRFKTIEPGYRPFIYYTWVNLFNQILNEIFTIRIGNNTVNANIYVLFEALLFCWLFYNLKTISKKQTLLILVGSLLILWVYDNLIWHNLNVVNSFFRISYSFILIFLAINHLNKLILTVKKNLLRNAGFLICIGILFFYSYKAIVEVFFLIKLPASNQFYMNVFEIMILVSLLVYLIYALAALWIPRKQRFTLQSS